MSFDTHRLANLESNRVTISGRPVLAVLPAASRECNNGRGSGGEDGDCSDGGGELHLWEFHSGDTYRTTSFAFS